MEKYNALSKITNDYLDGSLARLVMEYESKKHLHICMQYKDKFENWYDYELILNKEIRKVEFIKHDCIKCTECVHLKRITEFETALVNYLYES